MHFRIKKAEGKRIPFLGDLYAFSLKNPAQTLAKCSPKETDVMEVKNGRTCLNLVVSGKLTEHISNDKIYEKDMPYGTYALQRHGGQGLFCGDNNTAELAYFTNKLRASLSIEMIKKRHRKVCEILEIELKKFDNSQTKVYIDVPSLCTRITLEILLVSLFGMSAKQACKDTIELIPAVRGLLSEVSKNIIANKLPLGKEIIKKYIFSKHSKEINFLYDYVRLQCERKKETQIKERIYIVDFYLYDEKLRLEKDINIVNLYKQLVTLIVAGHETTGNAIAFTIRDILQCDSAKELIMQEIREKKTNAEAYEIDIEALQRMPYIEACFYESLRLNPTAPAFHRKLKDKNKNRTVKTDNALVDPLTVLLNSVNKDKEYWGLDAEEYSPKRFYKKSLPKGFKPFGVGARSCTGRHFSVYEAKMVIIMLFNTFQISLLENTNKTVERLTAAPDYFMVELTKRKDKICFSHENIFLNHKR